MSKAFTSEESEDDGSFEPPPLPPGIQNYITSEGAHRFHREFQELKAKRAQLSVETVEAQTQVRLCDQRLRYLMSRVATFVPVDVSKQPIEEVRFGATVDVQNSSGEMNSWRIVGLDETDLSNAWISWMSPLATALLGHRIGERVPFQNEWLEIRAIRYV